MEMEIQFPGGDRIDAVAGPMRIITDQDGSAPAPFTLFLASIGTCAGIYVLGFCRQRGLPTEGLRIVQRHRVDPATRMISGIELEIELPAGFPEKYRDAVVRAADQCKVKRHLEAPPRFEVHTRVSETVA